MEVNFHQTRFKLIRHSEIGDRVTPVEAFLKLRDLAPDPVLLESSDYHSKEGALSFLCLEPIMEFRLVADQLTLSNHGISSHMTVENPASVAGLVDEWVNSIAVEGDTEQADWNGVFGFTSFNAVRHFQEIDTKPDSEIPDILYRFYRFILVFDHFHFRIHVLENVPEGEESRMDLMLHQLHGQRGATYPIRVGDVKRANMGDDDFLRMVERCKEHCQRGDVFQIVVSMAFERDLEGDPFSLYRALRSTNPSPYLYFFDYGSFKIIGSSPEAHLRIIDGNAEIHPIAGTYRRSGSDEEDARRAQLLLEDPKENSEHVMLVDLARNDLNRIASDVSVDSFKEVQFFSHVIHLTSKVSGKLEGFTPYAAFASTFPAGTLSGAPKHRALELIAEYEPAARQPYGGAVGMISLGGDLNHAILIRSFVCKGSTLSYQAGAGIVISSDPRSELQEVHNKVAALERAIEIVNQGEIS